MRVRLATRKDLEAIGDLWVELIAFHAALDDRFQLPSGGRTGYIRHINNALRDDTFHVLVAEEAGQMIGYVMGYTAHNPPIFPQPRYGFIADLCVSAQARRQGAGELLVRAMRAWFADQGLQHVQLNVAYCNPVSQAFWRKMGCTDYLCHMWMRL